MSNFFKNINQTLLKKHPLLWNTRFPIALGIALLINVIYFLIGFFSFDYPNDLLGYSILSEGQMYILPSVLTSVLFLIVWVYYYSQNNAFKSKFPLTKSYLRKEFFLILIVMFFNIIYMFSFMFGFRLNGHLQTKNIDIVAKTQRANVAMMFLPIERQSFDINGSCDSVFKERTVNSYKISVVDSMVTHFEDSLRLVYDLDSRDVINVRRWDVEQLLTDWGVIESPPTQTAEELQENASKVSHSIEKGRHIPMDPPKEYSYHYYCQNYYSSYNTLKSNQKLNSELGRSWIKAKAKNKIKKAIEVFLKDLDEAGVRHNLNPELWAKRTLQDSILSRNFATLENINKYDVTEMYEDSDAIEASTYDNYLDHVWELKQYPFKDFKKFEGYLAVLSVALLFTFFIFMFRLNGIKPLLLGVVFAGVLALIAALVFFVFKLDNKEGLSLVLLNIFLVGLVFAGIYAVQRKSKKLKAGILLHLGLVALLILPSVLFVDVYILTEPITKRFALYYLENAVSVTFHQPVNFWLEKNDELLASLYPFLIIALVIFWFIPMSKKLRANPDE